MTRKMNTFGSLWTGLSLCVGVLVLCAPAFAASDYFAYIVSTEKGIYLSQFDSAAGTLSDPVLAAEGKGMNFVEVHPNGKVLYAAQRTRNPPGGKLAAYAIDAASGRLERLGETDTRDGPAHVNVDATARVAVTANYGGGSISAMPVREDGMLGALSQFIECEGSSVHPTRQREPHPHSAFFSKDNRFVAVPDLGTDRVMVYKVDHGSAKLTPNNPPFAKLAPGSGPRHMAFHDNGRSAYVLNELASTVAVFDYDAARGVFAHRQTISTLPADFSGANSTAEVLIHPSGKFLYASNRGHDSIALFEIDAATGRLTMVEQVSTQGETPRNFRLGPNGKFLLAANQRSGTAVLFRLDADTGRMTPTGRTLEVPAALCVRFVKRD